MKYVNKNWNGKNRTAAAENSQNNANKDRCYVPKYVHDAVGGMRRKNKGNTFYLKMKLADCFSRV
jgi:hypothetical protein